MLGLKADTPEEAVDSYAQAVFELGKRVGTPMSFKDHGVDYDNSRCTKNSFIRCIRRSMYTS